MPTNANSEVKALAETLIMAFNNTSENILSTLTNDEKIAYALSVAQANCTFTVIDEKVAEIYFKGAEDLICKIQSATEETEDFLVNLAKMQLTSAKKFMAKK